jgi:hypothetical protein
MDPANPKKRDIRPVRTIGATDLDMLTRCRGRVASGPDIGELRRAR